MLFLDVVDLDLIQFAALGVVCGKACSLLKGAVRELLTISFYDDVRAWDFLRVEPGTLHAITAGVEHLEVQQNSDITYRLYDYDRLWNGKKRELHVEKCKDVITVPARELSDAIIHDEDDSQGIRLLNSGKYYNVSRVNVTSDLQIEVKEHYILFSVVEVFGLLGNVK